MGPTIFIVEDDVDTREMLETFLELEGYRVETAANGRQALERLNKGLRASVILLVSTGSPTRIGTIWLGFSITGNPAAFSRRFKARARS